MIVNNYESIIIIQPDMTKTETKEMIDSLRKLFEKISAPGTVELEDWGVKKLAYPIGKKKTGHYLLFNFKAPQNLISDVLDPKLHTDPQVMKHIIVKKDSDEYTEEYTVTQDEQKLEEEMVTPDALDVLLGLAKYKKGDEKNGGQKNS